jgi:hypothetical protein
MTAVLHASTTRHAEWGGQARYLRIVLHDTTAAMQAAARRYRGGNWQGTGGAFHPAPVKERHDGTTWIRTEAPHWAGVMRLSRTYLEAEVVAHECVHAGLAIYRMDVAGYVQLGEGCGRREETLAYIIGDVTAQVTGALRGAGAWD